MPHSSWKQFWYDFKGLYSHQMSSIFFTGTKKLAAIFIGLLVFVAILSFFENHWFSKDTPLWETTLKIQQKNNLEGLIIMSPEKSNILFYYEINDKEILGLFVNQFKHANERKWPGHDLGCFKAQMTFCFGEERINLIVEVPNNDKSDIYLKLLGDRDYEKICIPGLGPWILEHAPYGEEGKNPARREVFDKIVKVFFINGKMATNPDIKILDCGENPWIPFEAYSFDFTDFSPFHKYANCLDKVEIKILINMLPGFMLAALKSPESLLAEKILLNLNRFSRSEIYQLTEEERSTITDFICVLKKEMSNLEPKISQIYFKWVLNEGLLGD